MVIIILYSWSKNELLLQHRQHNNDTTSNSDYINSYLLHDIPSFTSRETACFAFSKLSFMFFLFSATSKNILPLKSSAKNTQILTLS